MIQNLEILFLKICAWYYSTPWIVGLPILIIGLAFFIVQFYKKQETVLPGIIGLSIIFFEIYFHIFNSDTALQLIDAALVRLYEPRGNAGSFAFLDFFLEPIFSFFVAPRQYRYIHEEIFFFTLASYLFFVFRVGYKEYLKTGRILGDVSLSSFTAEESLRPTRSEFNELGSGDLALNEVILSQWTRPSGESGDTALPVKDLRGSEGIALKSGFLVIKRGERNRHILTVAKTGSGKTSRLILPILYNDIMSKERSVICIDSKPEMWKQLANLSAKYNPERNILLFNPLDTVRSLSWNILDKITEDTDAKLIANTIVMATDNPNSKSDSPFFRNNALSVLNSVMVGLLHDQSEILSMPRIHELIQSGMKPLCDWLEAHPEAYRTSRTFVELARSGSQNADTIMSELAMRISAWDLKAIRATTATNEINLKDLIDKPTLFIVEFRESELEMLRPLANVIVIEILRYLTKTAEECKGQSLPRPVGLVIDEFASALGRLPDIHVKLNTLRSRNISIVAAIQSTAQVKANYGDDADSVLAGFSTKIFMPSLDVQDAEWASKETGQMTVRYNTASTGSNKKLIEWFASKNISTQEQVQQRAVLTPDEIGRPSDNRMTFFLPNTPPFQGHLVPFFEIPKVLARFKEFKDKPQLQLRKSPIQYKEEKTVSPPAKNNKGKPGTSSTSGSNNASNNSGKNSGNNNALPAGITDTSTWTDDEIWKKYEELKEKLEWKNTTGSAKKWWEAFENENQTRKALILRLAEELTNRKATITEFFLSYVYSNTDNIQANLHYLDYSRLKKEEEKKKREAAQKKKKNDASKKVA